MLFSLEEKKRIIFFHSENPVKQKDLKKLEEIKTKEGGCLLTCKGKEGNCGDVLYLLMVRKDDYIVKCLFSGEGSCLLTRAIANMLCIYLEEKSFKQAKEMLHYCELAMKGEENNDLEFSIYRDLEILKGTASSSRVECITLVLEGFREILKTEK